MFRQLVTPGFPSPTPTAAVIKNINSLFTYHPLQVSALIETVWLNRANAANSATSAPFVPWAPQLAHFLLTADFFSGYDWSGGTPSKLPSLALTQPTDQPGILNTWDGVSATNLAHSTNWDHMIYAYVVENTRIYEIFRKVLEKYTFGEELETPSVQSQLFWRNVEFLIYGDAMPSMLWRTTSRVRRDEVADRLTSYYWMFGLDLSHAPDLGGATSVSKARSFKPGFYSDL